MKSLRIAVIGAGPAGLAAALQLRRCAIEADLFERNRPGGLLRHARLVENYPGFPEGIRGEDLADLMEKHARLHGVRIHKETVTGLSSGPAGYRLKTSVRSADYDLVVIASGTKPKKLACLTGSPETAPFIYHDVLPLRDRKGETVGIIGGGDAAHDYALSLAEAGHRVLVFFRGLRPNCLPLLSNLVKKIDKIRLFPGREPEAAYMERGSFRIRLRHHGRGEEYELDSLLVAVGREPDLEFIEKGLQGGVVSFQPRGGLYFAGDVRNGPRRQAAIAVGNGIESAMAISAVCCRR